MTVRKWRNALIFTAIIVLVASGIYFYQYGEADAIGINQVNSKNEKVEYKDYVVRSENISRGFTLVGVTAPKKEEVVYIPSQIKTADNLISIGAYVNEGDKLIALEQDSYNVVTGSTRATYLEQLQNYNKAKNWDRSPEIIRLINSLEETKLRLEQSKKSLESVKVLLDKGLVPRQEYESNKLSVLRDELALENAKNELNTRRVTGKENLQIAELRYKSAESAWNFFKTNYPDAFVRTPIDGYVGRPPRQGQATQTDPENSDIISGKPVFTILSTDRLLVQANVGEKDVNNIKIGQTVQIKDIGGHSVNIPGQISAISRVNSSNDKSFPRFELLVEIDPKELGDNLRFGLSATIFINTQSTGNAILIPIDAIRSEGNSAYVFLKRTSDNSSFKKNVTIGKSTFNKIEILSGVNNGDVLLIPGK